MIEKEIVVRFLRQCNEYAYKSIARKNERGETQEIGPWESYIEFNQHSIDEIESGELDHWFEHHVSQTSHVAIDFEGLEHHERSKWLSALVSPRPLSVFSTRQGNGQWNLSAITSCMHVSTSPPYIIVSLSKHRDGEIRDTLHHLRTSKHGTLNFFQGQQEVIQLIETAARPLHFEQSEASTLDLEEQPDENGLLPRAVAALGVELVQEYEMPQAVAKLVLLKVNKVWFSMPEAPEQIPNMLCQHGLDRIGRLLTSEQTVIDTHYEPHRAPDDTS
ncbi:MAG: flavin reductase [archaeon]|nr:flavin reductase [archaeon]MDA1167795.1 flavin reductase [archaeon]